MADEYYGNSGGDDAAPSETGEGMAGGKRDPGMGEETNETTLVPKSMFEGKELKPGDEFYFTVVAIHENEVEVKYKHDEKEPGEEKGTDSPEQAFDSKFSMMGG